ncbi:MAG: hypothetical protein SRB1_03008 [Desulfobacteraceae bacterium Eth-SRB1]|nr:MAG: hypothetical protein SRB1_03008 [Desulfobacteraceae bacterium Eth-SRB1]
MAKGQREVEKRNDTGFVYVLHECSVGTFASYHNAGSRRHKPFC